MENFLPLIIMLILGAIIKGKRKDKSSGEAEAKPFTAGQKQPGSPVRKIKEVSTEMYKEIQREFQQETERTTNTTTTTMTPISAKPIAVEAQYKEFWKRSS